MLNLVLVSYGDKKRIAQFASLIQNKFNQLISENNGNVYDLNTLWKAESNICLLRIKGKLDFPTKKYIEKEYWGTLGRTNYDDLYSRWFSSNTDEESFCAQSISYCQTNLVSLLKRMFVTPKRKGKTLLYDVRVRYQYGETDNDKTFCIIELCLNQSLCSFDFLGFSQHLIHVLDETFSDVFVSAYITNNIKYPVSNLSLLKEFDANVLDSKILGVEYSFYMHNSIKALNSHYNCVESTNYRIKKLSNGIQYVFNGDVLEFESASNKPATVFFKSILIPAYRVFNWSDLCELKESFSEIPEMVSVYYDSHSPTDPTIVFSSGYTISQLDNLPMLNDLRPWKHYQTNHII